MEILLNKYKNIASVDVDTYQKIEIENKTSLITEYDIRNALSATEIFDAEREAYDVYRIYGRIEYLSLLNRLSLSYKDLAAFFTPENTNIKDIFNSFTFYLLKAGNGYTNIAGSSIKYVRYFEVIATSDNFELYNAGFTKNIYGDQVYAFNFNRDFNVATYVDNFGFPATELYLYAKYKPSVNGLIQPETMSGTSWGTNGTPVKIPIYNTLINVGDRIYGDLIEYSKSLFLQEQLSPQTYYIRTPYKNSSNVNTYLQWKYNPIIPFRLKYFDSGLSQANTGTTVYEQETSIPYYATKLDDNGNYVWREILPQGYIDPETNLGVDYPFINKRRYLFSAITLDISPDLEDLTTKNAFAEIKFKDPSSLNFKPNNLDNIGKPCQ